MVLQVYTASCVLHNLSIVKGSGRGGQHQQQPALGEEGDFAVYVSVYGKVQAEPNVNPNDQRRKEGERCIFLPGLGCLATYVDYVPYVSLSRLGGGIYPTTIVRIPGSAGTHRREHFDG